MQAGVLRGLMDYLIKGQKPLWFWAMPSLLCTHLRITSTNLGSFTKLGTQKPSGNNENVILWTPLLIVSRTGIGYRDLSSYRTRNHKEINKGNMTHTWNTVHEICVIKYYMWLLRITDHYMWLLRIGHTLFPDWILKMTPSYALFLLALPCWKVQINTYRHLCI